MEENPMIEILKYVDYFVKTSSIHLHIWDSASREMSNAIIRLIQKRTGKTIGQILKSDKDGWGSTSLEEKLFFIMDLSKAGHTNFTKEMHKIYMKEKGKNGKSTH